MQLLKMFSLKTVLQHISFEQPQTRNTLNNSFSHQCFPSASSSSTFHSSVLLLHQHEEEKIPPKKINLALCFGFTWFCEVLRSILTVHPCECRALTVSWPAERRPMSLGGSLRAGQAEAGCEKEQCHGYRIVLFAGATTPAVRAQSTQG